MNDEGMWIILRKRRTMELVYTDLWYLKDRWDTLSSSRKGMLNTFRQTLRDLPQTYDNPAIAIQNIPQREVWF